MFGYSVLTKWGVKGGSKVVRMKPCGIRGTRVDYTPWYQQELTVTLLNNNVPTHLEYVAHIPRIPRGSIRATFCLLSSATHPPCFYIFLHVFQIPI